jgi:hypothetical protein
MLAVRPLMAPQTELDPKLVTPPPPTLRPFVSSPDGVPKIPVTKGVVCTGASSCRLDPTSLRNMALLQIMNGRCSRSEAAASA